jgi:hypothetical protein
MELRPKSRWINEDVDDLSSSASVLDEQVAESETGHDPTGAAPEAAKGFVQGFFLWSTLEGGETTRDAAVLGHDVRNVPDKARAMTCKRMLPRMMLFFAKYLAQYR